MTLALIGFAIVNVAMVHYMLTIAKETVPEDVRPLAAAETIGMTLAMAGAIMNPSVGTIIIGLMSLMLGGLILFLLRIRRLPDGELVVSVGDAMAPLAAPDQDGNLVDLSTLQGKRLLVKFFRGSW